jgi:hypothetical protein
MALTSIVAARNAGLTAQFVTALGASGTAELWNGTKPANHGAPAGTLLATLNLGNPAGTVSAGVWTSAAYTQSNGSHVTGTPTFLRLKDSSAAVQHDIDIGAGVGNVQFTGTVTTGQNVTGSFTITAGNAP